MGWGVHPQGLYASIMRLKKYNLPIYITENGTATNDEQWRIDYIAQHLQAVHTAIKDRADVRGYFHWTSVDNFEWDMGWMPRFGLISFDPDTFERTVKRGGKFYAEVAAENALTPEIMEKYLEKKKKKSKREKSSRKTKKK
jgi:beta-glucosidase